MGKKLNSVKSCRGEVDEFSLSAAKLRHHDYLKTIEPDRCDSRRADLQQASWWLQVGFRQF